MKRLFLSLLTCILTCIAAYAQNHHISSTQNTPHKAIRIRDVYQKYLDSLQIAKDSSLYSKHKNKNKETAKSIVRMLMPIAFYKDIIHNAFSPSGEEDSLSARLLHIYLQHPEWVNISSRQLEAQKSTLDDINRPIKHDAELVKKVEPEVPNPEVTPVSVLITKPNFWTIQGDYSLQFLQNYISGNWYNGGESNYSALASVIMQANYNNKQKVKWENKIELRFGLQSSRSDSLHKYKTNDDLIRLTSKLGLQASKRWYYTVQMIAQTQFWHSYRSNDPAIYSDFLAPFNLNLSVGMDYTADWLNHKLKGNIHLAPLAYNMKYTRLLELTQRLGLKDGKHFLHDFGSEFTIDLEWKLLENLAWRTRLYGYTTYSRSEIEWENTFTFKFNRYISSKVFVYPRFDDGVTRIDDYGFWQLKEYLSLGFQYSF